MKKTFFLLMMVLFTGLLLAQGGITGTASTSLDVPDVALYGLVPNVGVKVDLSGVSGSAGVGLGGFCVPVGYTTTDFIFNSATNGDLPGNPGATPPTLVFVHTDKTIAASNGWFSVVGATSVDSTATTYTVANFTGRVLGFGNINFDVDPTGLPSQNQLSLSSKWTSGNGGPESIPSTSTDNNLSVLGKIIVANCDFGSGTGTDALIYDLDNYYWYIRGVGNYKWGKTGIIPVPGDYNGDGTTDIAYYDPSDRKWYVKSIGTYNWGLADVIPVPGDYNGDGTTDCAYYNPNNGWWYIRNVGNYKWTRPDAIPVPGDYDGDGTTDLAFFDPNIGRWYIKDYGNYYWKKTNLILTPGDYNGDGTTDLAFFDPTIGWWYIKGIGNYKWTRSSAVIPVPGDYDGNNSTDLAFYDTTNGYWYVKSGTNFKWYRSNGLYLSK